MSKFSTMNARKVPQCRVIDTLGCRFSV